MEIMTKNMYDSCKWIHEIFLSGTQLVKPILESRELPYLYVYGPAGANEEETDIMRIQICIDLTKWLNGGKKPEWINDISRISETQLIGLDGTSITACGLWIDADPPNLNWVMDDSFEASRLRAELIDFICMKGKQNV